MPRFTLGHPPQTREALWWTVRALFGVTIPRTRVCPDHVAPFDAFGDAYFGECSIETDGNGQPLPPREISGAIWHASRGLAGKSKTLSILGLACAYLRGADITILGGSMAQSTNVHEYMVSAMGYGNIPEDMTLDQTATRIQLTNKGRVRPLPASQRNVRGPHPSILLMDEVDEMEIDIYDAALGQPMPQPNYLGETVETFTVRSSTWQNPQGCVLEGTAVTTRRGELPIEQIRVGDEVPTRAGWRHVSNVINTGRQECVTVEMASGRSVTCTPWHPFWTSAGWARADALAPGAHVVALVRRMAVVEGALALADTLGTATLRAGALPGAGQCEVVPVIADRLHSLHRVGASVVLGGGDHLEVSGVHACVAGAATSPDMVERKVVGDRPVDLHPHPAVSEEDALAGNQPAVGLVPVAVLADVQRPDDAVVGFEIDDDVFADDQVVRVHHHGMVLPTWDLTVEDTHEYVAGGVLVHNTLTEIFRRAEETPGITPIYRWCYKENHVQNNPKVVIDLGDGRSKSLNEGWLAERTIQNKRDEISNEMFRVEYDLGEPSIGNRAFNTDLVDAAFSLKFKADDLVGNGPGFVKQRVEKDLEEYVFEFWKRGARYVGGADWAKEQDKTVIWVARIDEEQRRLVYYYRANRRPYPAMIGAFNQALKAYRIRAEHSAHDNTGLGDVVDDYVTEGVVPYQMTGEKRVILLQNYINAVEKGAWRMPRIQSAYLEHKYCRTGDIYSTAGDFHAPDTVVAGALAEHCAARFKPLAAPIILTRDERPTRIQAQFTRPEPTERGELAPEESTRAFSLLV